MEQLPNQVQDFLSVESVATIFGVHIYPVRLWIKQGRLQAFLPGGRSKGWRIPTVEVERLLHEGGDSRTEWERYHAAPRI
ncbi:MAG TPA: helix-turn-helix domain-containing protein [Chloroflexota bacterium]|nr:helix-turn-helix domain-containing protein [Chloroflexota bacterium]